MATVDRYQYEAVDASGRTLSGEVEAAYVDDAIKELRSQGLYPTSLRNVSRAVPPQDRGVQFVQLALLQAIHDGATEVVFDLSGPDAASIQRCIAGNWSALPPSSDAAVGEVRRALRDMSGASDCGCAALCTEKAVDLTSALPSFRPLTARLCFRSSADAPEKISVTPRPAESTD